MSFEAYKVAVRLSLINGVSAGLISMVGQFQSLGKQIGNTNASLTTTEVLLARLKKQTLIGGALLGVGGVGLDLVGKLIKPASEYAHQLNIMNMAGLKQQEIAEAVGDAWKNTHTVITTTATENLRSLMDLRNILGGMGEARLALPIVSRIQAVLAASSEGQISGNSKELAYSMAKALDIIGAAQSPKAFEHQAELMAKVITATQGRVTPEAFKSVFQYARQAKYSLSDEFKYEILPSLIQENSSTGGSGGGSRGVGPMLAAMYRTTNQGYINKKSLPLLHQLGLVDASTALKTTTQGTTVGHFKEYGLAASNPFQWVQTILMPAIQAHYKGHATREQIQDTINQIFRGNQLAAALSLEFAMKPLNFTRDQAIIRGAMSPEDAYKSAFSNDPNTAEKALHAQWENFKTALGVNIVPIVVPALIKLSEGLNTLGHWARNHPDLTKDLVIGFAALAGAMAFSGTVLLSTAAFKALGLVVGPGGMLIGGIADVTSVLGKLGFAAAAFAAAYAGWQVGSHIGGAIDRAIAEKTGYSTSSLRDWLHDSWIGKKTGWFDYGQDENLRFMQAPSRTPNRSIVQEPIRQKPEQPTNSVAMTSLGGSQPVIHNHFYVDGREISNHLIGPENMTGPQGLNPLQSRPMPGTSGMGY